MISLLVCALDVSGQLTPALTRSLPYQVFMHLLDIFVEGVLNGLLHLEALDLISLHLLDGFHDVIHAVGVSIISSEVDQ